MAPPKKSYAFWILGKVVKALFVLAIFSVMGFMFWRVTMSGRIPKQMRTIVPNDTLYEAYVQTDGALTVFTQEQSSITKTEESYGYFAVPRFVYIKEAKQFQVLLRYNNSTLEAVANDFSLAEALPRGEEIFLVNLTRITDLTPEDKSDNTDDSEMFQSERYLPTRYEIDTTSLYTYILYTFDGVEIKDDTQVVYLDIFYPKTEGGFPTDEQKPIGTLRLYHCESQNLPVTLSKKEKDALAAYK